MPRIPQLFLCVTLFLPLATIPTPRPQEVPAPAAMPAPAPPKGPLAAFHWLSGRWVMEQGQGPGRQRLEETWSPPIGDAMVGMFRWDRGGAVWLYELMSLEAGADEVHLHLRHFERGLIPWKSEREPKTGALRWKLEKVAGTEAVFTNPEAPEVKRVTYRREGKKLTILLAGEKEVLHAFRFVLAEG